MTRFVVIILFLGIAILLFFTQTNPFFNDIKILKSEKQSLDEALQYSRELQTIRDDLLNEYNVISQEDIERLNKILPSEISSGELIIMLEDRARNRGFLLKKIDVSEKKTAQDPFLDSSVPIGAPPPPFRTIDLTLSLSGSYDAFLLLLEDLEKSLRVIDIGQIDFVSGTGMSDDITEFKITARTYASVSSLAVSGAIVDVAQNEGIGEETREILVMLSKLKAIKIDSDFFQNDVFRSLQDFAPVITLPTDYGRPNPFRPAQ